MLRRILDAVAGDPSAPTAWRRLPRPHDAPVPRRDDHDPGPLCRAGPHGSRPGDAGGKRQPHGHVARAPGFGSPESLRRAFTRNLDTTPGPTGHASVPRTPRATANAPDALEVSGEHRQSPESDSPALPRRGRSGLLDGPPRRRLRERGPPRGRARKERRSTRLQYPDLMADESHDSHRVRRRTVVDGDAFARPYMSVAGDAQGEVPVGRVPAALRRDRLAAPETVTRPRMVQHRVHSVDRMLRREVTSLRSLFPLPTAWRASGSKVRIRALHGSFYGHGVTQGVRWDCEVAGSGDPESRQEAAA